MFPLQVRDAAGTAAVAGGAAVGLLGIAALATNLFGGRSTERRTSSD